LPSTFSSIVVVEVHC